MLPFLDDSGAIQVARPAAELVNALEHHRDQLDARIRCITRNRDAITQYLDTIRANHP
jgi:hypothetical protein